MCNARRCLYCFDLWRIMLGIIMFGTLGPEYYIVLFTLCVPPKYKTNSTGPDGCPHARDTQQEHKTGDNCGGIYVTEKKVARKIIAELERCKTPTVRVDGRVSVHILQRLARAAQEDTLPDFGLVRVRDSLHTTKEREQETDKIK